MLMLCSHGATLRVVLFAVLGTQKKNKNARFEGSRLFCCWHASCTVSPDGQHQQHFFWFLVLGVIASLLTFLRSEKSVTIFMSTTWFEA